MIRHACRHEHEVQQAAASGRWTAELRRHADGCVTCREIVFITSSLAGDAPVAPRRLSPAILWAKARHARRRRAETTAARIIIWGQMITGIVGVGVLAYFGASAEFWAGLGTSGNTSGGVPVSWMIGAAAAVAAVSLVTLRWVTREH